VANYIYLVECPSVHPSKRAFLSRDKAYAEAKELVFSLLDSSGVDESDFGIDFSRLGGEGSGPNDWHELSCQWNDFYDVLCEPEMHVLIFEVPLSG
jgi:hypothetical protein